MFKEFDRSSLMQPLYLQGSGIKAFAHLGNTFLKQGKFKQSLTYYQRALKAAINGQVKWPNEDSFEKSYLINHEYHFIYCPIPKVACSSFKKFMISLSNLENKEQILKLPQRLFHSYVSHELSLSAIYSHAEALTLLKEGEYFKFTFVRNPWERLTSAYLNKFVDAPRGTNTNLPLAKQVIKDIYQANNLEPNYDESITFRQFVEYIAITDDYQLDGHWKPQHLFLGNTKFDFIGRFENLETDFAYIQEKLGFIHSLPWSNKSQQDAKKSGNEQPSLSQHYCDYSPRELRRLKHYPGCKAFYTSELSDAVKKRYAKDIELFEYDRHV